MNTDWKSVKSQWEQMCLKSRMEQREGGGTSLNVNRQKAARAQWTWERPPKVILVSSGDRQRPGAWGPGQPPRVLLRRQPRWWGMVIFLFQAMLYPQSVFFFQVWPKMSGGLHSSRCGQRSHSWWIWKAVHGSDVQPPQPPTQDCPHTSLYCQ